MPGVSLKNFTKRPLPSVRGACTRIANEVLPLWDISLVFVGRSRARHLNERLRGKIYVPNVLSYVVGEKSGEIIICTDEAKKQASAYSMTEREFVLYLFIHGALHIKGRVHGDKMEACARMLLAKFALDDEHSSPPGDRQSAGVAKSIARSLPNEPTHRHGHRHRHVPGKNGRRRRTR